MFKAIFFDLDDTLVDAMECHRIANRFSFINLGIDYEEVERKTAQIDFLGMTVKETCRIKRDLIGISEEQLPLDKLYTERQKIFLGNLDKMIKILPGAEEAIVQVKNSNLILAIVSSGSREYIETAIEHLEVKNNVDFIIGAEDITNGKPAPDCYLKAFEMVKNNGINKDDCLVVEDSNNGIIAAQRAGLKTLLVPSKYNLIPNKVTPDFRIQSLEEFNIILNTQ